MKSAEHEIIELALKKASPAHQKVGWVKIFNKVLVPVHKVFSFKAKAFSFCLFYCTLHRHSERNEESSYFSSGSFDFVLCTSLRMTAWKQSLFTF
jgi:hypothetical protein